MLCILSKSHNIFEHLATEEFLLKERGEDIFMLWRSGPSVVIGKHQNAMAEINYRFLREKGIKIARRLSGGGTVYHDLGNLNFTFILNGESGKLVDFKRFVQPISNFLITLGVTAETSGRNDILVNGLKISGNAEHIFKNRVLHHGTLLFDTELDMLRLAIKVVPGKYIDKAVQSKRSEVTNLSGYINPPLNVEEFTDNLFRHLVLAHDGEIYTLSEDETLKINQLSNTKYTRWEWVFGYSPPFSLHKDFIISQQHFSIEMKVLKGLITHFELKPSKLEGTDMSRLEEFFTGCRYDFDEMDSILVLAGFDTKSREILLEQLF